MLCDFGSAVTVFIQWIGLSTLTDRSLLISSPEDMRLRLSFSTFAIVSVGLNAGEVNFLSSLDSLAPIAMMCQTLW